MKRVSSRGQGMKIFDPSTPAATTEDGTTADTESARTGLAAASEPVALPESPRPPTAKRDLAAGALDTAARAEPRDTETGVVEAYSSPRERGVLPLRQARRRPPATNTSKPTPRKVSYYFSGDTIGWVEDLEYDLRRLLEGAPHVSRSRIVEVAIERLRAEISRLGGLPSDLLETLRREDVAPRASVTRRRDDTDPIP